MFFDGKRKQEYFVIAFRGMVVTNAPDKKPVFAKALTGSGGRRGIRTPGPVTVNGFQDRRNRPLCHPSGRKINACRAIFKIII